MEKQEEGGGTQVVGWNLVAMSLEDKEQAEKLWKERAKGRAYLGVRSIGDDVERNAKWCQEVLGKELDASAKKITICARSRSWWNGEIKKRRSQLGREKRRRRRSAATAQLQKWMQRAKDRMWDYYVKNLWGAEVWRAAKFGNPWAGGPDRQGCETGE